MNKIKKILISFIIVGIVTSSLFSVALPDPQDPLVSNSYKKVLTPYEGTSSHRMAMGSAGLGVGGFYDSYLYNPANISKDGFKLLLPTLHLTVNNIQKLVAPKDSENNLEDGIFQVIESIQTASTDSEKNAAFGSLANLILNSMNYGYGELMTVNVRTGLKFKNFGFNLEVQDKLRSYNAGADMTTASVLDQADISTSLAFGSNIPLGSMFSLDFGASLAFNYRVYSSVLGSDAILGIISDIQDGNNIQESLMTTIPLAAGYSIPVNVGVNFNMPLGFSLSAVGRNFNGNYNFVAYNNVNSFLKYDEILTGIIGNSYSGSTQVQPDSNSSFVVENDWSLDLGATWNLDLLGGLIKPTVALDFKDCYGLIKDAVEDTKTDAEMLSNLLSSINFGAQVSLLNIFDVRAGLSQGYKSLGVGFDLPILLHVDAAYYWSEYGDTLGQSPSDALSIRCSVISGK